MKTSQTSAGEGQGGAWSSPRPFRCGRPGGEPVVYRPASPAREPFDGLTNRVRAGRLAAIGAEKI